MSASPRTCQNCGSPLTPGATYCLHCGAQVVEPIVQRPGEFEPFPPEHPEPSAPTEPQVVQQPVVLPPPQSRASYTSGGYGQQPPVTPGPGQVGGPPQPPISETPKGLRISLIISIIVAVVLLIIIVSGLFYFLGQRANPTPTPTPVPGVTPTPTPTPGTTPTPTPTPTSVPFRVTVIDMSVNPLSIAGMTCGTQLTVTYTATFHVLANGPGGTIQFMYTTDGGRTTKSGLIQFSPGETTKQFPFTSTGMLAENGAFPGAGQVTTTSPNVISSQTLTPTGSCTPPPTATP
jgi:zinc ribbon protein